MITILKANKELNEVDFVRAYDILIYAYAQTEAEIWGDNYARISKEDFREIVNSEELFLAYKEGQVVGCVRLLKVNEETYSFGLLAVDFNIKGQGIGRKLVEKAEQEATLFGAKFMDIEILKAKDIKVKSKIDLHNWYTRLGYVFFRTDSFMSLKPMEASKAIKLINPAVFDQYRKLLN
tara:strand:+ start:2424 stop:2960 length:537 start_codon:yes stop_codon:yes gene_type:complete